MLFLLRNVNNGSVFYLVLKEQFVVGRKDCDLLISNDQSISRKHAIIRIKDAQISVEDYGSKYKTLHNKTEITPHIEIPLNINDEIQFGIINSKYRLEQLTIVTTGTRLNSSERIKLKNDLSVIGGRYIENWTSDCTHLTVQKITLTVKILHAIIDEKHIVKPIYWSKFAENVARNLPPPIIDKDCKPPIAEALLNNVEFKTDSSRKTLFKGKLFVFSKEANKKQMEEIIRKAGGISISWEQDPMPIEDIKDSPKDFIIIQPTDVSDDSNLNQVIKHFSKQGKRTIPLQEIAMAILLCSCEKNCNPKFNKVDEVFLKKHPNEPTQGSALVFDTQSQYFTATKCKEEEDEGQVIIPGTLDTEMVQTKEEPAEQLPKDDNSLPKSFKRLLQDNVGKHPAKMPRLEKSTNPSKPSQSSTVTRETRDEFLTKDKNADICETAADSSTSKIKSEENPLCKNVKIKTENPLSSNKKHNNITQSNDDNSKRFVSDGSNKRLIDDDVDFSPYKKKKHENIFTSTRLSDNLDVSNNFPKSSKISNINNSTWLSKGYTVTETHFIEEFEDTDQLKPAIVVKCMTKVPVRPRIYSSIIADGKYSKRVTFKKFTKIVTKKPQRLIIGKHNSVAVGPADITGIIDSRRQDNFSGDKGKSSVKIKQEV